MLSSAPAVDGLERLLDAGEALSGLPLRDIDAGGTEADVGDTRVAQPLLFLCDWAWGQALLERGVVPFGLAGHSLGELAALAVAGAYSVEAGLELVVERSRLMAQCAADTPGAMAAIIGLDGPVVSAVIETVVGVWLANDNSHGQVVISGTQDGVTRASEHLSAAGARRIVPLKVAGGFHSPLMEPARAAFELLLEGTVFRDAACPVYQNTEPTPATDGPTLKRRLAQQITSPVRWTETMSALADGGPITVLEAEIGRAHV